MHDQLVTGSADGVAVGRREEHFAGRCLGVVVEDLGESLVERRGSIGVAVEVGAGADDMESLAQAGLCGPGPVFVGLTQRGLARVVVVREELHAGGIEILHAEGGEHFLFVVDFGRPARPPGRGIGFVEADLVNEGRAGRGLGDAGRGPPVVGRLVVLESEFSHARGATADPTRALGEAAIDRVVDECLEAATDRVALGPDDDVVRAFDKLRSTDTVGSFGAADGARGIVIDPLGDVAGVGVVVVRGGRALVAGGVIDPAPDGFDIRFGPGGAGLIAVHDAGGKLFRVLAFEEKRLLIPHPDIAVDAGGIVALAGIRVGSTVEVHTTVELQQDILRGAVGARDDGKIAVFHHGDGGLIGVVGRGDAVGIPAVGQSVGIESRVTVRTIAAGHGDTRNFFAVLIEGDGGIGPEGRKLGSAPAEDVIPAGWNNDTAEFPGILVEPAHEGTVRALRVLVKVGVGGEAGDNRSGLTLRGVVVEHRNHGDFLGGGAAARAAELVRVVAALVSHVVAIGPAPFLQAAGEVVVELEDVGDAGIAKLAEELRVGVPRESTAGFAEGACFVVAVGIDEAHALTEHVVGVLEFFLRGVVVVVAVGVGHAHAGRESTRAGRVKTGQGSPGIAEVAIEGGAEVIVDQTHAGIDIAAVARGLPEVLTEDQSIVAALLFAENGITVVRVAETAGDVELALHGAEVAGIAGVLVVTRHLAEEVVGHVFDRIETQAVGFGAVHFPAHGADEIGANVFNVSTAIGDDVGLGMGAQLLVGCPRPKLGPGLVDQPAEVDAVAILVVVVLLGAVEVADEGVFRMGLALAPAEVGVGRFVRDVDEVGKAEVLHLPRIVPIPRVVPLAVKAVLGFAQVEVLRHHARIKLGFVLAAGRRGFIEARDVEGPVVHDVVEIDADAEAVRHFHHVLQVGFGAVAGADRAALVFLPEVERIPHVVADGESTGAFGRRRQPERAVARLGQLGHLAGDLGVGNVEELEQPLGTRGRGLAPQKEETADQGDREPPPKCRGELHLGTP